MTVTTSLLTLAVTIPNVSRLSKLYNGPHLLGTFNGVDLYAIVAGIFVRLGLVNRPMKLKLLLEFIHEISQSYLDNPSNVAESRIKTYYILTEYQISIYFSKLEVCAVLVAALGHDVLHPGTSNLFQINARTEVAARYNNISVLENQSLDFLMDLIRKYDLFRKLLFDEDEDGGFTWSQPSGTFNWAAAPNITSPISFSAMGSNSIFNASQTRYPEKDSVISPFDVSDIPPLSHHTRDNSALDTRLSNNSGNFESLRTPLGETTGLRESRSVDHTPLAMSPHNSTSTSNVGSSVTWASRSSTVRWMNQSNAADSGSSTQNRKHISAFATGFTPMPTSYTNPPSQPSPLHTTILPPSNETLEDPLTTISSAPVGSILHSPTSRSQHQQSGHGSRRQSRKGAGGPSALTRSRVGDATIAADKLVAQCVLETDMKVHFELVKRLDALAQKFEMNEDASEHKGETGAVFRSSTNPSPSGGFQQTTSIEVKPVGVTPIKPSVKPAVLAQDIVARVSTIHFRVPSEVVETENHDRQPFAGHSMDRPVSAGSVPAPITTPEGSRKLERSDRHLLLCAVLHAADISNAGRP
ncbi:High affinity cAMP-specific and IBMX-insensitive 3',5'-cyclic phosphodiesterase 9A [Gonapodya sp. JEL0774]|nr:High affinity cAMP-specific and IBMX-insensitive 3',5'-cyclic phosphodiesterase 9A [Gonapodya sp. JEL0774]